MEVKLLKVEDTFLIEGRGLVIAGLLEDNAPAFKTNDKIKFYCSDDSEIYSEISGIEMINFGQAPAENQRKKIAFLVRNLDDKREILKNAQVVLIK